jgi:hypothetical protein
MASLSSDLPEILFCTCFHCDAEVDTSEEFLEGYEVIKAAAPERVTDPNWFFWAPGMDFESEHPAVREAVARAIEAEMIVRFDEGGPHWGAYAPILIGGRALSILEH